MTTNLKDLRERRGRLVADMRGLLDAASAESRDLTTEEQSHYDEMFGEQERVGGTDRARGATAGSRPPYGRNGGPWRQR